MRWHLSWRSDPSVRPLADRHYNRQSIGADGFVPPGRCLVLTTECRRAFWVTSWPFAEFVKHAWAGCWMNSAFRNEAPDVFRASEMIREAVACTREAFGDPPALGMLTFIDPAHVRSAKEEGGVIGYSYRRAGFKHVGETKAGLAAFQLLGHRMPPPQAPIGWQGRLFA